MATKLLSMRDIGTACVIQIRTTEQLAHDAPSCFCCQGHVLAAGHPFRFYQIDQVYSESLVCDRCFGESIDHWRARGLLAVTKGGAVISSP